MVKLMIDDNNINEFISCSPLEITHLEISRCTKIINIILDNLYKFKNIYKLNLYNNNIPEIKGLDNLVNLQILYLCGNQITEIKGLDNLINLQELVLSTNQITEIKGLNNLVNLQNLVLVDNKITEIKGLDNLVKLKYVYLDYNQITEIKGLDNLVNLHKLYLSNNQITEIKKLDNLVNLLQLRLENNKIPEIKGLCNLVNLQQLQLENNKITEIKNFDNLIKLKKLDLCNNQITELPLNLCNFRNIDYFNYNNNLIKYIHLSVQRWLKRIKTKNIILKVLQDEFYNKTYQYFIDKIHYLLNVLVSHDDDIDLQNFNSDQINNIITSLINKFFDETHLKSVVKKELLERQYSEVIINEWLEYI